VLTSLGTLTSIEAGAGWPARGLIVIVPSMTYDG